jgi:NAD(P)-dependent dehydrogenase (short-subunit alcohol dehydrogenase family)
MDLVRRAFEVNVIAPLDFTQGVVKRWVRSKARGKVVFTSSVLGLLKPRISGSTTTKISHRA